MEILLLHTQWRLFFKVRPLHDNVNNKLFPKRCKVYISNINNNGKDEETFAVTNQHSWLFCDYILPQKQNFHRDKCLQWSGQLVRRTWKCADDISLVSGPVSSSGLTSRSKNLDQSELDKHRPSHTGTSTPQHSTSIRTVVIYRLCCSGGFKQHILRDHLHSWAAAWRQLPILLEATR